MATKKPVADKAEEQEILEEEAAQQIADEWAEEIEMTVPRKPKGDDPQYYVCVNDRRFYIPANGRRQKLPKPVALILQEALDAEINAEEFADSMPHMEPEKA